MKAKRLYGLVAAALLAFLLPPPATAAEANDLEPFREELRGYVAELEKLPPSLLEAVYDQPGALSGAREQIDAMTPEQLTSLRDALKQVPYWQSLPGVLSSSLHEGSETAPFDLSGAFDALAPAQDPAEFRRNWVGFLDRLDTIPEETAGDGFGQRVARVRETMARMSADELSGLQAALKRRVPAWRQALRRHAARVGRAGGVDVINRNVPWGVEFGVSYQPDESETAGTSPAAAEPSSTTVGGEGNGTVGFGQIQTENDSPPPAGCSGGLPGVLCEIDKIFDSIIAFPGQVASFAVNAFNDLINLLSPVVDIPDDAADFIALMGIDLNDPDWFLDTVANIPPLRPPCPADGTFIPGLGEVGTPRATFACKRGLHWGAQALYDNAPDDIWGAPGKLVFAAFYYPIDYLCLCFEEGSDLRFDDLQAEHRDLTEQMLDVNVSTRASQAGLDSALAAVADLDGDVAAAAAKLATIDGKADALLAGEADQSEFLSDFRDLALRMRIEANMQQTGSNRVSMFQLPEAHGGLLEVVQVIVENTVQSRIDAGRDVGGALAEIYQGDQDYLATRYKDAYTHYRKAYRMALNGGVDDFAE